MVEIEQLGEYTGHRGSIFAMVIDEDERYAYTSGDDGMVVRWDLHSKTDLGEGIMQTGSSIYTIALIPGRDLLAVGASDGTLSLIDLKARAVVATYRKTEGSIYGLFYDEVQDCLWGLHAHGALSAHRLPDLEEGYYHRIAQGNLRSLTPMLDQPYFFIGSSDEHIYVFDPRTKKLRSRWKAHEHSVFCLAVHPDAKYLISGGRDAFLRVWDLQASEFRNSHQIPAHNYTVNDLAFSPQRDYFITASRDKTLKLWDAYHFELLKVVDFARNEGHKHSVNRVIWLSKDNSVLSCSDDRRVLRWRISVEK
ncbi:MAG: WD40 repeat domain-containing protein [Bacteroidota bacterium]